MPDILRQNVRFECNGIDLVHPIDRQPAGCYPYLSNVRVTQEGRLESRPGYSAVGGVASGTKKLHSIRRLNDTSLAYAAVGYTYVAGNDTTLLAGIESALTQIDTGYSGNPLSLLTFRPDQSPVAWMYVYDANKMVKVRPDGAIRSIGVVPPTTAPTIEYGQPAWANVADGQSIVGWAFTGAVSAMSTFDRTNAGAFTISSVLYNSGTTGWCCLTPSAGNYFWAGEWMTIILSGGPETVIVREIHPAITATTIQSITYDSGTTGACSIVLTGNPPGLDRNSVIRIAGAENCRVLEVNLSPDGTTYAIRCVTTGARAATNAVTGIVSWYTYTTGTHAAGETITCTASMASMPSAGTGTIQVKSVFALANPLNRAISITDDYLHVSVFLQNPQNVAKLTLLVDVDASTAAGTPFTGNFWAWDIPGSTFQATSSTGNTWTDVVIPLSQGVRHGGDMTRSLATIQAIGLQMTTTGACAWGYDDWYMFGTYAPNVPTNDPAGIIYQSRFRDRSTGAASIPGPATRYALFPQREQILVTAPTTAATGIDQIDIYREGGAVASFVYVGSVTNNNVTPNVFSDAQSDTSVAGSPAPDLTLIQPWPTVGLDWLGTVNVSGTSVTWASGSQFSTLLIAASIITINGVAYQTFGNPRSATFLELTTSAGAQTGVAFTVAGPTLAGQALPYAFGPLEGPYNPVIFSLGDPINAGTIYFTNTANADAANDQNSLELCPPGEPLISGETWNGIAIAGSRDNVYLIRYGFQTVPYQFSRLPAASGMWSRWACARGPDGIYYLGRDGIYKASDSGVESVTDALLYPLFPHDGQAAVTVNGMVPVDMTQTSRLRLRAADDDLYFDYLDTGGSSRTLRYEVSRKRWFPHTYADGPTMHYLVEGTATAPSTPQLLLLGSVFGNVYLSGGNLDDTTAITCVVQTPSLDGGDERAQKLPVDLLLDADQAGTVTSAVFYDNLTITGPSVAIVTGANRAQYLENISSLADLRLNHNFTVKFTWTGGPAGPRLYAFEPAQYIQPFLSQRITTQYLNLDFPGWKHHRRLYAGLISNSEVYLTIKTQDGRTFGPYTIPSTGGRYRIWPLMIDANCKDLAFAYQLEGNGNTFALFPEAFTIETKDWIEPSYISLAVMKT